MFTNTSGVAILYKESLAEREQDMSTMNNIIRERRKALGITQKELAAMLSISDKTVSRWESGNQMPDAIVLPDLVEALEISLNDLYGIKCNVKATEKLQTSGEFPKVKLWIAIVYKIAMVIGLVVFIFGAMDLIRLNTSNVYQYVERVFGNAFLYVGGGVCVVFEIAYSIIYRNTYFYNSRYLVDDVKISGLCGICIATVLTLIFPYFYVLPVSYCYQLFAVLIVIVVEATMIFQKRKLREEGIALGKKISVISVITISFCALTLLGLFVYFKCFYISQFSGNDKTSVMLRMLFELSGEDPPFITKTRLYSLLALSVPMLLSLLINYIELLIKVKRLKGDR